MKSIVYLLFIPILLLAVAENCEKKSSMANGSSANVISDTIKCFRKDNPNILTKSIEYKDGKKDGKLFKYIGSSWKYKIGNENYITTIEDYQNDKQHGKTTIFYEKSKNPRVLIYYDKGKRVYEKDFYEDGKIKKLSYSGWDQKLQKYLSGGGGRISYNKDGSISNVSCSAAMQDEAKSICGYGQIGKKITLKNRNKHSIGQYLNGKKYGKWLKYQNNEITSIKTYNENSKYEGMVKEYDKKGNILKELIYKDGVTQNGETYKYFPDNQIQEKIVYKNGKKNLITRYYQNKHIKEIIQLNPYCISYQKFYNKTGNLASEECYQETDIPSYFYSTKIVGTSKYYYENGKLHKEATWRNGKIIKLKIYKKDGTLEKDEKYHKDGSIKLGV